MMRLLLQFAALYAFLAATASAFGVPSASTKILNSSTQVSSRRAFVGALTTSVGITLLSNVSPALAADEQKVDEVRFRSRISVVLVEKTTTALSDQLGESA